MNARSQLICAWCGIFCPLVMFAGLWPAADFFPPTPPTATADEIAALYQSNTNGIRFGMILVLVAGALYAAFIAGISAQMRRMEHRETPVLSYLQLAGGAVTTAFFVIPAMFWSVAAFRPERSPEITLTLNDMGWMFFVMPFAVAVVQTIALGYAIISDRGNPPVMPRWVGFLNFWIALLFIPGGLLTFFKTGPFAWNGLLAFWVPASVFSLWFFVVAAYIIKAVKRQAAIG
jgi:phage shock protein PspC (stress-responsive transcriptional regulator)